MLTIVSGFIGYGLTDSEVQRYFKAIRALKLLFLIKEVKIFNEPASHLVNALAKVGNILIPALFIIYIYAVVGLYTFSGNPYPIQTLNTTDAEAPTISIRIPIGQFTMMKYSCAGKDRVLLSMENSSSASTR